MEKENELLKRYLSDDERYADLINGFGFGGRQVVKAEDLSDLDSQTGYHKKEREKYRDLLRKTAFGVNFAVIGIENQSEVHYLMPVRCMGYDVREYERQQAVIKKEVRKRQGLTDAEFLSGFTKKDRLHPCVTFVLYYGDGWDGSEDLYGLLDFTDIPDELKGMVNNYQINLLDVKKLESTDMFRTDLKQVFDFIRYSEDKEMLRLLTEENPAYKEMDEAAYDVAVAFSKAEELIEKKGNILKGGKADMCKALQELLQDERQEGIQEGIKEGILTNINSLVKNMNISAEEAMELLDIPESEREVYLQKLSENP